MSTNSLGISSSSSASASSLGADPGQLAAGLLKNAGPFSQRDFSLKSTLHRDLVASSATLSAHGSHLHWATFVDSKIFATLFPTNCL